MNFDKIGEFLLGGFAWQCIHTFLTFLSYLSGLGLLHYFIKKLLRNLNLTLPVHIKFKPDRVVQTRFHQERRLHYNGFDFSDDVETNASSDSQRRFNQKRRNHFNGFDLPDDVESNCSFDSEASDEFKFDAPPPYSSDPTAPYLE